MARGTKPENDRDAPEQVVMPEAHDADPRIAEPSERIAEPSELSALSVDGDGYGRDGIGMVWRVLAIVGVLNWIAGVTWYALPSLNAGVTPLELFQFAGAVCLLPALVGGFWLLAMRTGTAEARRFGATARAMRAEAAGLERVIGTLSRKIEENRIRLAEQTTQLIVLGDGAAARLQSLTQGLREEARAAETSAQAVETAVAAAERRVEVVLASLPKAHDEMRGMAARVDAAGLLASQRASALDVQLSTLVERGRDAGKVAGDAAERLAAHLARMEATSETATARLEAVTATMSTEVDGLLDRTAEAVDEARKGIAAQGEAMLAMLSANQAALDRAGRDSADGLADRIAKIEAAVARVSESLTAEHGRSEALVVALGEGIARADAQLAALHAEGTARTEALTASVSALGGSFDAMAEAMRAGEERARGVITLSESLLTALDAAAREVDETLPDALARLDARIGESRRALAEAKPELMALVTAAEGTHDAIEAIADVVAAQRDTLARTSDRLLEALDAGRAKADVLEAAVDAAVNTTSRFANEAVPELVEALVRVRGSADGAVKDTREALDAVVAQAAATLEETGNAALRRALDSGVRRQLAELADATEAAVAAAARASERLTQQMLGIAGTTAEVESRIAAAKAEREVAEKEGFARRVPLLIDALNSASIDITQCFSREVSDSAWTAYLKGDRGVFTRRAVRLLETGEARDIATLYDDSERFRDDVNRYIHDFEAMLRQILALHDGSALGVTLLSSDMGKLYVALAQAIERLRT